MDGWGAALLAIPGQLIAGGACSYCKVRIGYVLNYEKNVKEVQELRSQLELKRNDIKARAEEEIRRENRVMAEEVSALLDEATNLLETEVDWEDMLKDSKERKKAEKCCPAGFCSWNPKYRHYLSRIAKEKAAQIDEIKKRMTERASTQLTVAKTPPPFETDPANFCPDLKSRVEILNLIIKKVRDDRVKIIAIYGMGGAGKTTLAEEVVKVADKEKWFSKVVMVEMSKDLDIKKIQDQIAEQINFNGLSGITFERERAKRLREALLAKDNDTKKLLVVLDNIWDLQPTLYVLGIPDGCKIVLTSREKRVCLGMGAEADNIIHVHDLDDQEARVLLMKRVGQSIIVKENYEPVLRELLEKCPHLPLSICVLGDVLRSNQDLTFWRDAVRQLKSLVPTQADEVLLGKTYSVLKLSYDSIGNRDKRCFFLLCGLFKPGTDISITDLFRYGIGLNLFENETSLDYASERAYKWANELKCSSLLTEVDSKKYSVRIHDDVRAAVMIFAVQEDHMFHVGAVSPFLKVDAYEKHTAISVWSYDNINSLIGRKLDKLLLFSLVDGQLFSLVNGPPRPKLGDGFFIHMENIKILKLKDMYRMETLPSSIEHLVSLRTLLLEECTNLVDMSNICKLVKLRVLSLRGSSRISKLPDDFGALAELKLLDMTYCRCLKEIIAGTIMKLEQLESLYMSRSFCGWEKGGSMASLSELQCLPHLRALEIDLKDLKQLSDGTNFPAWNFSRFHISINSSRVYRDPSKSRRHLMVQDASADDDIKKGLMPLIRCAESLWLQNVRNLEYVCEKDGVINLSSIQIFGCQALKYLVNPSGLSYGRSSRFHNLQELSLYRLETLQPYALSIENSSRLRVLRVCDCEALEYIFWSPTNLETPEVQEATRSNKEIEFTSLKELKLTRLPRLLGCCSEINNANGTCRSLFTEKMKFPALKSLEIDGLGKIMEIWDGRGKELSGAFPELHWVTLQNCHNARHMWIEKLHSESEYISFDLKELQSLRIESCDSMEQVIFIEDDTAIGVNLIDKISFLNLLDLTLTDLKSLRCFYSGKPSIEFPNLRVLLLRSVVKMMTFTEESRINKVKKTNEVLFNETVGFHNLYFLHIHDMPELERISECDDEDNGPSNCSIFSESTIQNSTWLPSLKELEFVRLPKLKHLPLSISSKLELLWIENSFLGKESLITPRSILRGRSLRLLRHLTIRACKDMKAIIAKENSEEDERQIEIVFPHLQYVSLSRMPLLHAFNAASYPIEAPVLKNVNINGKIVAGNPNLNLNLLFEQHNHQLQATTNSQPGVH